MFINNTSTNLTQILSKLENSLKKAKNNLQWFETRSPEIYEFLDKSYTVPTTTGK